MDPDMVRNAITEKARSMAQASIFSSNGLSGKMLAIPIAIVLCIIWDGAWYQRGGRSEKCLILEPIVSYRLSPLPGVRPSAIR
jgi:hypothetical protein